MRGLAVFVLACAAACAGSEPDNAANGEEAVHANPSPFTADDVTVLAPLTSLDAMTPRDGLVPDAIAAQLGQLVEHYTADDTLARLRVVCTRFDPKDGNSGQLRVVLQPLLVTDGTLGAQDAAVHVFYDLDSATTRELAARLHAPHDVPALVKEFTARGSVSRATFLRNTDVKGNAWVFGGFDIAAGNAIPITVARTGGNEQHITVNGSGPFTDGLSPAPSGADTLGLLLDPIRLGILRDANPATAKTQVDLGIAGANALEDPARFDSNTADCASCHLAESARIYGSTGVFAPAAAETLRACGYVGTKAIMSQRTKNESAVAAQRMGALL